MSAHVEQVRAELRIDSRFVATDRPRLSWAVVTTEPNWRQAAVQLRCGDEQIRLDGDASVLVKWPFAPLVPGEQREIQVQVIAESGTVTEWSSALPLQAGFLAPGAWVAQPIGLAEPARIAQPVLLRKAFSVDRPVQQALLFYTALGAADLEINGVPVDEDVLSPGWTSYHDRLIHETVDVTALLRVGNNVLGGWLAGAWYTEKYGFGGLASRTYADQPRLLAQLTLDYGDGDVATIATDGSWQVIGDGPVLESGIYGGEHHDARLDRPGWSTPGADDAGWTPAHVVPEQVAAARGADRPARSPNRGTAGRSGAHRSIGSADPGLRPEPGRLAADPALRTGRDDDHPSARRGPRKRRTVPATPPAGRCHGQLRAAR